MMEIIRFDRIVSVSSQTQGHGARNILEGEINPDRTWTCESGAEKAVLILQLEGAAVLTSIHVGNAHSAFVEVLVGRAADSADHFESFLPMSSFMSPHESKTGTNPDRTRFFTKTDFNEATASKAWDRVKVVCSQPFNKHVSYGLRFFKIHGEKEAKKSNALANLDDRDEIQVGSFFKKRTSTGDKVLTVGEEMKTVEESTPSSSIGETTEKRMSEKRPKPSRDGKEERKESESRAIGRRSKEGGTSRKRKEETKGKEKTGKDEKSVHGETVKRRREDKREKNKRPFGKLMEDVVLVISGFKNPLRGDIRNMALEMGAKYSADWEPHCTHLVCAYENTPKCQQVKGQGKIVKKDWVERCHKDRKRYPWRRFALDKADTKKPESEEEVESEEDPEPEPEPEDQIGTASMGRNSEAEKKPKSTASKAKHGGDDYDAATDDDEDKKEVVDTSDYPMPYLPDIFSLKTFFLEPSLRNKAMLERYIVAYNGVLTETFDVHVDFYVTDKGGAPLKLFRMKAPNVVAVKPSWIWEINSKQKCTPTTPHLVT